MSVDFVMVPLAALGVDKSWILCPRWVIHGTTEPGPLVLIGDANNNPAARVVCSWPLLRGPQARITALGRPGHMAVTQRGVITASSGRIEQELAHMLQHVFRLGQLDQLTDATFLSSSTSESSGSVGQPCER